MEYKLDGGIIISNCVWYGLKILDEDNATYYVFIDGTLKKKHRVKIKYNNKGAYVTIYKNKYYFNDIVRFQ